MTRLLLTLLLLTVACDQPDSLVDDTDQPLPATLEGETPAHGYWALTRWPTLVLDVEGSCPEEAVEAALAPYRKAGIDIAHEAGECRPDAFHVEDGRVCLRTDAEMDKAGKAWWRDHPGTTDRITAGSIRIAPRCNPVTIAHELGHVIGFGHSEDPTHTMYGVEHHNNDFQGELELMAERRAVELARR